MIPLVSTSVGTVLGTVMSIVISTVVSTLLTLCAVRTVVSIEVSWLLPGIFLGGESIVMLLFSDQISGGGKSLPGGGGTNCLRGAPRGTTRCQWGVSIRGTTLNFYQIS